MESFSRTGHKKSIMLFHKKELFSLGLGQRNGKSHVDGKRWNGGERYVFIIIVINPRATVCSHLAIVTHVSTRWVENYSPTERGDIKQRYSPKQINSNACKHEMGRELFAHRTWRYQTKIFPQTNRTSSSFVHVRWVENYSPTERGDIKQRYSPKQIGQARVLFMFAHEEDYERSS
ncbi:hypothetical protein QE152_g13358 [Popillia japonica]|uniref:Uncharacterized protein n=1 Tax=Popillia japonica TaxID=7064 RepID=A0AAW1LE94_POPJA